jgi:hypothetical protein
MDLIIRIAPSPIWLAFRHEPGFGMNYLGKHGTGFSGQFTKAPIAPAIGTVPFEERIRPLPLDPFDPIPLRL